jgi:hypothetical protein
MVVVAASVFLRELCGRSLRALRLKAFDRKERKDFAGDAEKTAPRVWMETSAPPAFERKHWKGNDCRVVLRLVISFPEFAESE